MLTRRITMVVAALSVAAAIQAPVAAQAEPWSLFDWTRTLSQSSWEAPVYPVTPVAVTPAPRRQRVATVVVPEPVRRDPPRMIIVGIGF